MIYIQQIINYKFIIKCDRIHYINITNIKIQFMFTAVFTVSLHWFLSWARWIHSIATHTIPSNIHSILPTYLRLRLPKILFPPGLPTNILYAFLFSPTRATCPANRILLDLRVVIIFGDVMKLLITWSVSKEFRINYVLIISLSHGKKIFFNIFHTWVNLNTTLRGHLFHISGLVALNKCLSICEA
jgi:hypothetical protein